jgi:hypothetical protein
VKIARRGMYEAPEPWNITVKFKKLASASGHIDPNGTRNLFPEFGW